MCHSSATCTARCAVAGAVGVTASAVPADELDTGVGPEPVGEVPGLPTVQDIHRPIPVAQVDQHRPVITSATHGEFIDTKHYHRPDRWVRRRRIRRSNVERLTGIPNAVANLDPARPAKASAMAARASCSPALRCACGSVRPETCSTKVPVLQSTRSQKNRRTLSRSTVC